MGTVPRIWKAADGTEFRRRYALTVDDHLAIAYSSRDFMSFWPYSMALALVALAVSLAATHGYWRSGDIAHFLLINGGVVLAAMVVGRALAHPVGRWVKKRLRHTLEKRQRLGDELDLTVNGQGVSMVWRGQTNHVPWATLVAVEEDARTFYFWISKVSAYVWPARLFEDDAEADRFREHVEEWLGRPVTPPLLAHMGDRRRADIDVGKIGY